jgi:hypothetical protein
MQFKVYPNPTSGNFTIVSIDEKIVNPTILITDITGRSVPFESIILDDYSIRVNIEPLVSGIYNLRFQSKVIKLLRY